MPIIISHYIPSYDHLNHGNGKANHWPNSPWLGEEIGFTTGARAQYAGAALRCFTDEQPTVRQFQNIPKPWLDLPIGTVLVNPGRIGKSFCETARI